MGVHYESMFVIPAQAGIQSGRTGKLRTVALNGGVARAGFPHSRE